MPKLEEAGNFEHCKLDYPEITNKYVFKCRATTTEGFHAYPSMFLFEQDGNTKNAGTLKDLNELFGWDGRNTAELLELVDGKRAGIYTKANGQYINAYFIVPSRQKTPKERAPRKDAIPISEVQAKWDTAVDPPGYAAPQGSTVETAALAPAEDLGISEENVPF